MNPPDLKLSNLQRTRSEIASALFEESDRGMVLVLCASLEGASKDIMMAALHADSPKSKESLDYHLRAGALSTHSVRTLLAYTLGLIGPSMYEDMRVLRDLRNHRAAHAGSRFAFSDAEIWTTVERLRLTPRLDHWKQVVPNPLVEHSAHGRTLAREHWKRRLQFTEYGAFAIGLLHVLPPSLQAIRAGQESKTLLEERVVEALESFTADYRKLPPLSEEPSQ